MTVNGKATHGDIPPDDGTMESFLARDRWLDEQDQYVDGGINFDDLPAADQLVGTEWVKAVEWQPIDAMTWIARRDPDLMKLVFGYRSMMRRLNIGPDKVERACRLVVVPHLGSELVEAELRLVSGLGRGPVYLGNEVLRLWPVPRNHREHADIDDLPEKRPAHRPTKRPEVLRIFRERVASGQTKQDRADEARVILKVWSSPNKPQQKTTSGFLARYYHDTVWVDDKLVDPEALLARLDSDKVDKVAG